MTQEDLGVWVKDSEQLLRLQGVEAKKLVETPENVKRIKEQILEKKTIDFLLKNAKVKEEPYVPKETQKKSSIATEQSSDNKLS